MDRAKRTDLIIVIVLAALVATLVLHLVAGGQQKASSPTTTAAEVTYQDYDGKTIGILTGTNMEAESFKHFPNSEYLYFDGYPNMNAALENGVIDAYLGDEPALKSIHAQQPQIDYIKERLTNNRYSFAFRKDDPREKELCDQFNEFLRKIKEDGTYDEIDATWFGTDESKKVVSLDGLTGENGTIHVVTTSTDEPFSYIKDGQHVGYDIDVAVRFCRENGYAIEIGDVDFQARIPALASGQYEFTTTMNVTPEREEAVLFSEPVSEGGIVVAVRSEDLAGTAQVAAQPSSFDGKRAGVITGSFHDSVVEECLPQSSIANYDSYTDLMEALNSEKIDYFLASTEVAGSLMESNPNIVALPDPVKSLDIGAMFAKTPKGAELKAQMDEFIVRMKADGTLDTIYEHWNDPASASTPVDMSGLTGENGTLRFATSGTKVPVSFQVGDQIAGTDPDIAVRFCRAYGYGIDVSVVNTAGIIPGITTGIYDFSLSDMVITPERQESVNFSEPYHATDMLLVCRKTDAGVTADDSPQDELGLIDGLALSFEKNFVREGRWKLIVQGVGTTCLITSLSVLFGSALAFGVCMLRRTGSRLANLLADIYVRLLQGTPTVVLLMILYYVVFGRTGMPAVWVAIIGFTLNFGAYGSEIMRSGIESVNAGQREAALALGYTEHQAFFDFIFPQAAVRFLPVLRGEAVSLLKSTSIVGYIAIQDITKMSDIIRSRTYEAFFPLIVTAVIYFVLAWLIALLTKALLAHIDPRQTARQKREA
ncbi:MAG: ABC transporter permease subunit [Atopobiaceae bacterium]|nr:ABC transporter permease subunit [Atopobiaceae bacterium]